MAKRIRHFQHFEQEQFETGHIFPNMNMDRRFRTFRHTLRYLEAKSNKLWLIIYESLVWLIYKKRTNICCESFYIIIKIVVSPSTHWSFINFWMRLILNDSSKGCSLHHVGMRHWYDSYYMSHSKMPVMVMRWWNKIEVI